MKPKKIKAVRMWGCALKDKFCVLRKTPGQGAFWEKNQRQYFLLPATAEAYDAMVEQMAVAQAGADGTYISPMSWHYEDATTVLASIGINRPKEGKA